MQRRSLFLPAVLALLAGLAYAADVTGTWVGQADGPDGAGMSITFHFKQDGAKLTGTVEGPGGNQLPIRDGKIDGDKLSFTISFQGPDGDMKMGHEGTIKGDEITLSMKREGGEGGPGRGRPMTLKRQK